MNFITSGIQCLETATQCSGGGTILKVGRAKVRYPMSLVLLIHLIQPATLRPWCRLPLIEMSTRDVPGVNGWPAGV
jgi:hypothetical protein